MRVFISSDIEGTAGICHWDEAGGSDVRWYGYFCTQMTREVAAACQGAIDAGATDILVKDAHGSGRNIDPTALPRGVQINRGWDGGLFSMVSGLNQDYSALAFTGYHAHAGSAGNPLSHSMMLGIDRLQINDMPGSEFLIHAYIAGLLQVPVAFLSGDEAVCQQAKAFLPNITIVAVNTGVGDSATCMHPDTAVDLIQEGMQQALHGDLTACQVKMPSRFKAEVGYQYSCHSPTKVILPGG